MRVFLTSVLLVSTAFVMLGGCGGGAQPTPPQTPVESPPSSDAPVSTPAAPPSDEPASPGQGPGPVAHACTEMGCVNGFSVSLEPSSRWPVGKYQFDFVVDGKKGSCAGALPLPACGKSALKCTGAVVAIGESGCALPPVEHAFSDLSFGTELVKNVSVKITHNGKERAKKDFQPTYKHSQPNGPDCPPVCDSAHESLKVF